MKKLWLILDCDYLLHRALYVFGDLSHEGNPTGAIYGFLKNIISLCNKFGTPHVAFCFDSPRSKRKEIYPPYKENRVKKEKEVTKEMIYLQNSYKEQKHILRTKYLPMIGFKNIFYQSGYESDDLIAMVKKAINFKNEDEAIIVSSDRDLYQLISRRVSWYNPQKKEIVNKAKFIKMFNIYPSQWGTVKAIAGCSGDNVKGVFGVGEKTAIAYLRDELPKRSKKFQCIRSEWGETVLKNVTLVKLPLRGCNPVKLKKDKLTQEGWDEVTMMLGMKRIQYHYIM